MQVTYSTGKKKSAVARVWVMPGTGHIAINRMDFRSYLRANGAAGQIQRNTVVEPLKVTNGLGKWDVWATVRGGGMQGQAVALRHGIALALRQHNYDALNPPLRSAGFVTRDRRIVERKKPGQPKARKKFQWVKR